MQQSGLKSNLCHTRSRHGHNATTNGTLNRREPATASRTLPTAKDAGFCAAGLQDAELGRTAIRAADAGFGLDVGLGHLWLSGVSKKNPAERLEVGSAGQTTPRRT